MNNETIATIMITVSLLALPFIFGLFYLATSDTPPKWMKRHAAN